MGRKHGKRDVFRKRSVGYDHGGRSAAYVAEGRRSQNHVGNAYPDARNGHTSAGKRTRTTTNCSSILRAGLVKRQRQKTSTTDTVVRSVTSVAFGPGALTTALTSADAKVRGGDRAGMQRTKSTWWTRKEARSSQDQLRTMSAAVPTQSKITAVNVTASSSAAPVSAGYKAATSRAQPASSPQQAGDQHANQLSAAIDDSAGIPGTAAGDRQSRRPQSGQMIPPNQIRKRIPQALKTMVVNRSGDAFTIIECRVFRSQAHDSKQDFILHLAVPGIFKTHPHLWNASHDWHCLGDTSLRGITFTNLGIKSVRPPVVQEALEGTTSAYRATRRSVKPHRHNVLLLDSASSPQAWKGSRRIEAIRVIGKLNELCSAYEASPVFQSLGIPLIPTVARPLLTTPTSETSITQARWEMGGDSRNGLHHALTVALKDMGRAADSLGAIRQRQGHQYPDARTRRKWIQATVHGVTGLLSFGLTEPTTQQRLLRMSIPACRFLLNPPSLRNPVRRSITSPICVNDLNAQW